MEACEGANTIVTDTWVSMGEEEQYEKKVRDFAGYQVTNKVSTHLFGKAYYLVIFIKYLNDIKYCLI